MRVMIVVGARPQFIKLWPVAMELDAKGVDCPVIHTGQHYDDQMSGVFFDELGISPPERTHSFGGLSEGAAVGGMLQAIVADIERLKPDILLVFGDTTSTLAGAIAANKTHVPLAHVEAGLRSFDRTMPEENNRVVTDHLSDWLFAPTNMAITNLNAENLTIGPRQVIQCGDVMYDAALLAASRIDEAATLERLELDSGAYHLATIHRASNTATAEQLTRVFDYIDSSAGEGTSVVLPIHPRTRQSVDNLGVTIPPRFRLVEPLAYLDLTAVLRGAKSVFTDSGGLQKEAYFHRVPCVTLRDQTEWTETIESGWNRLWTDTAGPGPRREIEEYGDGTASKQIVAALLS